MNITNCTPHAITIKSENGLTTVLQPSGIIPRVEMEDKNEAEYFGIKVTSRRPLHVIGLPLDDNGEPLPCIVSGMVIDALVGRHNLVGVVFAPDTTNGVIRNEKGHVVAVTQLVTVKA